MGKTIVDPSISKGLFVIKLLASRGNSFEEISRRTGISSEKIRRLVRKYVSCDGK
jgi:DNA-binding IclR family transcriptional regulator